MGTRAKQLVVMALQVDLAVDSEVMKRQDELAVL